MKSSLPATMGYCFVHTVILHPFSIRPATPRTEPRFRTAHPGGLLHFWGSLLDGASMGAKA